MVTCLGSLVQSCCGEGGTLRTNLTGVRGACVGRAWGVLAVSQPHWVCPRSRRVCFPSLHCSGSRLLCRDLSDAGPGLHALARSKPLRFRFSGTPQRRRLGWACVLCPSQVRAQLPPVEGCGSSPPPGQPLGFLGVERERLLRCAVCLFWGAGL